MLHKYFLFLDHFENNFFKNSITNLNIIYRNYSKQIKYSEILKLRSYCKKKKIRLYISNDIRLALKIKADGIYIPSFNKTMYINKLNLVKNFSIIGSAHNQIEITKKINQGCELIFLSPIFKVHKKRRDLGIPRFNLLTLNNNIKFIALGGIRKENIKYLKMLRVHGAGGITYFKKKPA